MKQHILYVLKLAWCLLKWSPIVHLFHDNSWFSKNCCLVLCEVNAMKSMKPCLKPLFTIPRIHVSITCQDIKMISQNTGAVVFQWLNQSWSHLYFILSCLSQLESAFLGNFGSSFLIWCVLCAVSHKRSSLYFARYL